MGYNEPRESLVKELQGVLKVKVHQFELAKYSDRPYLADELYLQIKRIEYLIRSLSKSTSDVE